MSSGGDMRCFPVTLRDCAGGLHLQCEQDVSPTRPHPHAPDPNNKCVVPQRIPVTSDHSISAHTQSEDTVLRFSGTPCVDVRTSAGTSPQGTRRGLPSSTHKPLSRQSFIRLGSERENWRHFDISEGKTAHTSNGSGLFDKGRINDSLRKVGAYSDCTEYGGLNNHMRCGILYECNNKRHSTVPAKAGSGHLSPTGNKRILQRCPNWLVQRLGHKTATRSQMISEHHNKLRKNNSDLNFSCNTQNPSRTCSSDASDHNSSDTNDYCYSSSSGSGDSVTYRSSDTCSRGSSVSNSCSCGRCSSTDYDDVFFYDSASSVGDRKEQFYDMDESPDRPLLLRYQRPIYTNFDTSHWTPSVGEVRHERLGKKCNVLGKEFHTEGARESKDGSLLKKLSAIRISNSPTCQSSSQRSRSTIRSRLSLRKAASSSPPSERRSLRICRFKRFNLGSGPSSGTESNFSSSRYFLTTSASLETLASPSPSTVSAASSQNLRAPGKTQYLSTTQGLTTTMLSSNVSGVLVDLGSRTGLTQDPSCLR
ncbi:hypothetical protein Hamer_G023528 [Homarus americanus]|uniref:Uncharacterized protein n=1 Tax=Homarus americanus TaxID=6706 RepID=A0A8J5JJJ1_HOMAM|nr:hypothetical protein Hamer_G023528 [Homarus americanus]